MSFGFSTGDVVLLVRLAWTTVQNSRKACGEHAELTCEITSLHVNLQRLEREIAKVESPINRPGDTCRQDLAPIVNGCGKTLDVLDRILEKYNSLSDGERSKRKLWKAVRFGNGELANVKDLRLKLIYYTGNLSLFLNMVSMGSMGVVEKQLCEAGDDLKDIRRSINSIAAHLMSDANKEGSVLTDYADDDKAVWRAFRRELVKEGFTSDFIREHKDTIQAYVKELGSSGILDDDDFKDSGNVSDDIVDMEPTQPTPQSRDEGIGSFESEAGAVRDSLSPHTATTAHVESLSGTGNRDPREHGAVLQNTPIAPAPLTMKNVSDTLPSTTQADAKSSTVVESKTGEAEKVDDRTNRHRSSAPIPISQDLAGAAGKDSIDQWNFGPTFRYYYYSFGDTKFLFDGSAGIKKDFGLLSNPLITWGMTLWLQTRKGFREVAAIRVRMRDRGQQSRTGRNALLRVSPLVDIPKRFAWDRLFLLTYIGRPRRVLYDLMQFGCSCIEPDPERWRIRKWPLPPENSEGEGYQDGDEYERSTSTTSSTEKGQAHAPPAASAAVQDSEDSSSTTEESETDDDESDDLSHSSSMEEEKGGWQGLKNKVRSMNVENRRRRQEREKEEARSVREMKRSLIREEKKRSSIKEKKNTNWLGLGNEAKLRKRPAKLMGPRPYKNSTSPSVQYPYPTFSLSNTVRYA